MSEEILNEAHVTKIEHTENGPIIVPDVEVSARIDELAATIIPVKVPEVAAETPAVEPECITTTHQIESVIVSIKCLVGIM